MPRSADLSPDERPMPEVAGVRHRMIDTGRLRMHVADAGAGTPVVQLHDWPQHWYAWRRLVPLLRGSCRKVLARLASRVA